MSASRTPVRRPSREKATARLAVSDDLPTPPLPGAAAELRRQGAPLVRRHHCKGEREAADTRNLCERLLDLLLERLTQRAARDREDDREGDDAVGDLDVPDHVEF